MINEVFYKHDHCNVEDIMCIMGLTRIWISEKCNLSSNHWAPPYNGMHLACFHLMLEIMGMTTHMRCLILMYIAIIK